MFEAECFLTEIFNIDKVTHEVIKTRTADEPLLGKCLTQELKNAQLTIGIIIKNQIESSGIRIRIIFVLRPPKGIIIILLLLILKSKRK